MHFQQLTAAALAAILPFATADFLIYESAANSFDLIDSSAHIETLSIFPSEPDCDMVMNDVPFTNYNNDLSIGGYSCDGCDTSTTAIVDQTITRLEFANGEDAIGSATSDPRPVLSYATGDRMSLYQSDGYQLHGGDGVYWGYCDRVQDGADDYNCFGGTNTPSGVLIFRCYSSLTVYGY